MFFYDASFLVCLWMFQCPMIISKEKKIWRQVLCLWRVLELFLLWKKVYIEYNIDFWQLHYRCKNLHGYNPFWNMDMDLCKCLKSFIYFIMSSVHNRILFVKCSRTNMLRIETKILNSHDLPIPYKTGSNYQSEKICLKMITLTVSISCKQDTYHNTVCKLFQIDLKLGFISYCKSYSPLWWKTSVLWHFIVHC